MAEPADEMPIARTEREIAANALWALMEAGLVSRASEVVTKAVDVVGITMQDLRDASVRFERMSRTRRAQRRFRPTTALTRGGLPAQAYERERPPRHGDLRSVPKLTAAGRKGAAEAVFAQLRVRGQLTCSRCGKEFESGQDAVIEAAHHADRCRG